MRTLNLGITFRNDVPARTVLYNSGIAQNVIFFYDLLEVMGHKPVLLTTQPERDQRLFIEGKKYRAISLDEVAANKIRLDIAFDGGWTINPQPQQVLREYHGARIVSLCYGHIMILDMEQVFLHESITTRLRTNTSDIVWTSPHLQAGRHYLSTIYNCPVRICPYIWEPYFVGARFEPGDYPCKPDIYVMEPNLGVLKNALIPMTIIEQLYRTAPDSFGKALILNARKLCERKYFLENIARHMQCLGRGVEKAYLTGRRTFTEVFKRADILLGHQWGCELNYLYFEALHKGVPLVHNSPAMADVGYYYPEFDVMAGMEQCLSALKDCSNVVMDRHENDAFIARHSIHNTKVQNAYQELIDEVMSLH